jgi:hypothetical protein
MISSVAFSVWFAGLLTSDAITTKPLRTLGAPITALAVTLSAGSVGTSYKRPEDLDVPAAWRGEPAKPSADVSANWWLGLPPPHANVRFCVVGFQLPLGAALRRSPRDQQLFADRSVRRSLHAQIPCCAIAFLRVPALGALAQLRPAILRELSTNSNSDLS